MSKVIIDSFTRSFIGIKELFNSCLNFSTTKVRPINFHRIPRIIYTISKNDYQPSTKDQILDLVKDIHKSKTEAVTSERMKKWSESLAKAKQKEST